MAELDATAMKTEVASSGTPMREREDGDSLVASLPADSDADEADSLVKSAEVVEEDEDEVAVGAVAEDMVEASEVQPAAAPQQCFVLMRL